ncbi:MAG TPA: sugar ABC transporter substrate-binding protein [Blastocatellia bacterium]|nr:sugar ABC transporter substrate-binding protein [Blastocatellia bacterium]
MKKLSAYLLAVCLLFAISCNRGNTTTTNQPTIALVLKTLNNPFFLDMKKGAEETARKLGVNLTVQAAEREVDVEKQMQIIENLIQTKVSALCITPSGSKEVVPAIVKANQANIPVIIVDTRVNAEALQAAQGKIAGFIGSDNLAGGRVAGELVAQKLGGKGKVAILEGIPGHETGDSRLKGFREVMAKHPGIQIVSSQTANWERDQGFNVFQNMLQAHPDIQALFACSDLMALGAVEAIAAAGKTGKIIVVGFDAFSEAREAVNKGTMAGTVAQSPYEMGKTAVENAAKILKGEKIQEDISLGVQLVTKQ